MSNHNYAINTTPQVKNKPANSDNIVPASVGQLVELLADREDLSGSKREKFIALLSRTMNSSRRGYFVENAILLMAVVATPTIGAAIFRATGPLPNWFTLFTSILTALSLIVGGYCLYRSRAQMRFQNFEIEWAHYCQTVRTVLITAEPGLLDRNLPAARIASAHKPAAN